MSWMHVGRLWSNGEPYLAVDSDLREHWHGGDEDVYRQIVVGLAGQPASLTVGPMTAALVGDGVVRDDSWMEVFTDPDGSIAIVQADGMDYRATGHRRVGLPDRRR